MAFSRENTATPQSIRDISIQITDLVNGSKAATFSVQVLMSDGTMRVRTGDLVPHITTAQRDGLLNFIAALRTQAAGQIL